jgi:hypothetical protein
MDIMGVIDGYPDAMDRAEARGWNAAATLANERIAALEAVVEAARPFLARYIEFIDSGDCGSWEPREEPMCKALIDALAALDAAHQEGT